MDTIDEKTIRMPAELADKWLAALRSGEYHQASGMLCRAAGGERHSAPTGYCCLGVLQVVADGDVEHYDDGRSRLLPSNQWLQDHGVSFNQPKANVYVRAPYLPSLGCAANFANDSGEFDFPAIADAIEAALERT
jgi:hypothetical protein